MKPHILYRDSIITPDEKRLPLDHPQLAEVRKIHAAVLETLGQKHRELSPRNRALPHMGDGLDEGRLLAVMAGEGIHYADEFIRELARHMERSRRTLKDGARIHPLGRFHDSSAVIGGLVCADAGMNKPLAAAFEGPCGKIRPELMERGLISYPFCASESVLVVVRPFYACDDAYLKNELEEGAYRKFYEDHNSAW